MSRRIAEASIKECKGKRWLHIWVPLPKQHRRKGTDRALVLLAAAIVGLVILLALQSSPEAIRFFLQLLMMATR
jgi:hypothetical protein